MPSALISCSLPGPTPAGGSAANRRHLKIPQPSYSPQWRLKLSIQININKTLLGKGRRWWEKGGCRHCSGVEDTVWRCCTSSQGTRNDSYKPKLLQAIDSHRSKEPTVELEIKLDLTMLCIHLETRKILQETIYFCSQLLPCPLVFSFLLLITA